MKTGDLIKSVMIYGLGSLILRSINILLLPLYSHLFHPEEYGQIDLLVSFATLIGILGMLQLESAVGRFFHETPESERQRLVSTGLLTALISSFIWSFLIAGFSMTMSEIILHQSQSWKSFVVVAVMVSVLNLFSFLAVVVRYLGRPILFSAASCIQLTTTILFSVFFVAYLKLGIEGAIGAQLLGYGVAGIFYFIKMRPLIVFEIHKPTLKTLLSYSLPSLPGVLVGWMHAYGSRFILNLLIGTAELGIFSAAARVASIFLLVEYSFRMAWGPFLWKTFNDPEHRSIYRKIFDQSLIILTLLLFGFFLFGNQIFRWLTPESYASGTQVLGIMALSYSISIVVGLVGIGADITKRTKYLSYAAFVSTGVQIALVFALTPLFGLTGYAIAHLVSSLVQLAFQWATTEMLYPIGFSKSKFVAFFTLWSFVLSLTLWTGENPWFSWIGFGALILSLPIFWKIRHMTQVSPEPVSKVVNA